MARIESYSGESTVLVQDKKQDQKPSATQCKGGRRCRYSAWRQGVVMAAVLVAMDTAAFAEQANNPPLARIQESIICCPNADITFNGWASIDVDGEVARWMWDLDGDGKTDTSCTGGELRLQAPATPQTQLVILRVRDNRQALSLPDSATLHVMESVPEVSLSADTSVAVGVRIFFNAKVNLFCGEPVLYEWDLDDDGTYEFRSRDKAATSKAFYRPGVHRTRFRVSDSNGAQGGGIRVVKVTAGL